MIDVNDNMRITTAYEKICEADSIHRNPPVIKQDGPDEFGEWESEDSLDGRINLRGKASNLRDYEIERASHFDNLVKCYKNNAEILEKLSKDLYNEGEISLSYKVRDILDELEEISSESEEKLSVKQSEVRKPYHVGSGGIYGRPNYVGHERFGW